jgi:hypothetical protein
MDAIVLPETDEVAKTSIKLNVIYAKKAFRSRFILFVDVDIMT